jgi:hypothetical protein
MKTRNKSEEDKIPFHENHREEPDEEMNDSDRADAYPDDDPLEVVIEEEKDEQEEQDTKDDLFDDDELDLDPTLDRDEW